MDRTNWRKGATLALAIVGLFLVLVGSLMSYRAYLEFRYIPAEGRSIKSELRKVTDRLSGSNTSTTHWKLFVEYEYWIGGEHFTSERIGSRRPSSNASSGQAPSSALKALVRRFETGKTIAVYVSAARPDTSVLIKSRLTGLWIVLGGVLAICLALRLR